MGENHTRDVDKDEFDEVILKQKQIIDILLDKFGSSLYFYTEAPDIDKDLLLKRNDIHSSVIAQYAIKKKLPVKFSSLNVWDRLQKGACDEQYIDDINKIFLEHPETMCVLVEIGLFHVMKMKEILQTTYPDINIIIVNTVSSDFLSENKHILMQNQEYGDLENLLITEQPYSSLNVTFKVIIEHNSEGEKIYICPVCGSRSGTYAPKFPKNKTSYFSHRFDCPNKNKFPVE